jgi:hypothetical protein
VSDDMNVSGEEPIVPEGTVAPLPAPPMIKPGTAKRNVLLIVAGVVVLVALVGFVAYAMMIASSVSAPTTVPVTATGPTTTPGTSVTTSSSVPGTEAILPVPDVQFEDVFAPRDPFKPIPPVTLVVATTSSTDGTGTGGGGSGSTSHVLTLVSIDASATPITAVVELGTSRYTVKAGDTVPNSQWHIDDITATGLYATYADGLQQLFLP